MLIDESADWKHLLATSSEATKYLQQGDVYKEGLKRETTILEFVLLENDFYVQARNILLMEVLCTEDEISENSRIHSFTSLLYNISIDEESFCIMKSALKR